jgi:hypothetical protein
MPPLSYSAALGRGLSPPIHLPEAPAPAIPPPSLSVARENCYRFSHPSVNNISQIAVALQQQFPELAKQVLPLNDKGSILLQFPAGVDVSSLVAKGLSLNHSKGAVHPLHNSTNSHLLEARLTGLLTDTLGVSSIKTHLQGFGKLMEWRELTFPGTQVKTGEVHLLLNLGDSTKVPAAVIKVDRDTWTEEVRFTTLGKPTFCHYCRSTTHKRPTCQEAPECKSCGSRAHAHAFCPKPRLAQPSTFVFSTPERHPEPAEPPTSKKRRKAAPEPAKSLLPGSRTVRAPPSGEKGPEATSKSWADSSHEDSLPSLDDLIPPAPALAQPPPAIPPPPAPPALSPPQPSSGEGDNMDEEL